MEGRHAHRVSHLPGGVGGDHNVVNVCLTRWEANRSAVVSTTSEQKRETNFHLPAGCA